MKRKFPELTLVCSSLEAGGAERVLSDLANAWVERGHSVTLVSVYAFESGKDFFSLDPRVRRIRLADSIDLARPSSGWWGRLLLLRRVLKEFRPKVAVAFMDKIAVTTLMATWGLGIPVIACERTNPAFHVIGRRWSLLRRLMYPLAGAVTVQTKTAGAGLNLKLPGLNLRVIPNAFSTVLAARKPLKRGQGNRVPRLVAMGRLSREKGIDLLVEAFSLVAGRFPRWELWVWGEGAERQRLERQVASLGLAGRVFLPGNTAAPWDELQKADIFVLPSRYEGMPNSMLEAMALGRPVVAFHCQGVLQELTRGGKDAVLVPEEDVKALSAELARLMNDEAERSRLGEAALSVRERYSPDRILALWDELFDEVMANTGRTARP